MPPTAERLKVRCYRCNQLLAVAPNKAGSVVACPKCKAELLIPHPGPPAGPTSEDSSVVSLQSGTFPSLVPATETPKPPGSEESPRPGSGDEIAALIPPELASLRPEDLRVEAEVFQTITRQPPPTPTSTSPFDEPFSFTAADIPPAPEPFFPPPPEPTSSAPAAAPAPAPPPLPIPPPAPAPEPAPVIPPIQFEPEAIRPPTDAPPRSVREVVLPASVVLAWSMLVLLAIPMAFVAGLLLGHFVWKTGP